MLKTRISLLDESGQTAVEYATVIALVVIAFVLMLAVLPGNLFASFWTHIQNTIT